MARREATVEPSARGEPAWVRDLVRATPQVPLMAPFMVYLLLLPLDGVFADAQRWIGMVVRAAVSLYVAWVFRRYYPPLGRIHGALALIVGLLAAWEWVAGQHLLDRLGLGRTLSPGSLFSTHPSIFTADAEPFDAAARLGGGGSFWLHVVVKIACACTVVPIVEELFWRGLMLRALVHWDRFETVPMGTFTWVSFLGTSLLSVLEHPANWGVSIGCWMIYNGLFYWTRSLRCLMVAHGVTNFALYVYVVRAGGAEWRFW